MGAARGARRGAARASVKKSTLGSGLPAHGNENAEGLS